MPCRGLHCDGCRDSGGGIVIVVIVALVLIAAAAKPVESAARIAVHVLADVLEVAFITVVVLAAAAVAVMLGRVGFGCAVATPAGPRPRVAVRSASPYGSLLR